MELLIVTASIFTIYVTLKGTNIKLPDDDTEMSKHLGVYVIKRYTVVILIIVHN